MRKSLFELLLCYPRGKSLNKDDVTFRGVMLEVRMELQLVKV